MLEYNPAVLVTSLALFTIFGIVGIASEIVNTVVGYSLLTIPILGTTILSFITYLKSND